MSTELETFIQQQKAKLVEERQDLAPMPEVSRRRTWDKAPRNLQDLILVENPEPAPSNVAPLGGYEDRRRQLQEERKMEYNQQMSAAKPPTGTPRQNGGSYKENVPPPHPRTPVEAGLIAKMGEHENRRLSLREERNREYNQLLAQQNNRRGRGNDFLTSQPPAPPPAAPPVRSASDAGFQASLPGLGDNMSVEKRKTEERNREYNNFLRQQQQQQLRNLDHRGGGDVQTAVGRQPGYGNYDQRERDQPPPPRNGWSTPTYEEILNRKRLEERSYRRHDDPEPYDAARGMRLGDVGYGRTSISDGHLNKDYDQYDQRNRDYDAGRRVKFVPEDGPLTGGQWPNNDPQLRRSRSRSRLETQQVDEDFSLARGQRAPKSAEHFNATLLVGSEVRESEDRRKKAAYRDELRRQIEESSANKLREKASAQAPAPSSDRQMMPSQHDVARYRPQPQQMDYNVGRPLPDLPPAESFGLQPYAGNSQTSIHPAVTGGNNGNILANGFNFPPMSGLGRSPYTNLGSGGQSGLGQFRSPLDEAYYYYGLQNPLDPGLGSGNMSFLPPRQLQQPMQQMQPNYNNNPQNFYGNNNNNMNNAPAAPSSSYTYNNAPGTAPPRNVSVPGLVDRDDREAAGEKKRTYQLELQRQIDEDKRKKQKDKEDKEAYERKLEEQIKNYNPFGRGGGGAPMKDAQGNIITLRKGQTAQNDTTSPGSSDRQGAPPPAPQGYVDPRWPAAAPTSQPAVDSFRSPTAAVPGAAGADGDSTFARGGNGIFGEPMTEEQKSAKSKYQDELRKQIEEKKQREKEEKERAAHEEAMIMKRIEEDNRKLKEQEENERRKAKEKAAEADRLRLELEEATKKEGERKKKEMEEARSERLRKEEEERRRQADEMRRPDSRQFTSGRTTRLVPPPSPPVPSSKQQLTSRIPSADVLDQLARMKQQLQREKRRVETDLHRERMEPEVYDPRLATKTDSVYNADVLGVNHRRPVILKRGRLGTGDPANPSTVDEFSAIRHTRRTDSRDEFFLRDFPSTPTDHDSLEAQQEALLRQQEEDLRQLKEGRPLPSRHEMANGFGLHRNVASPSGRISQPRDTPLLESESAFIDIPPSSSRADMRTDLDDLASQRPSQSRARRRQRLESESPRPGPSNPMGSVISLNPDELKERNDERLRRLKSLAGDDISTGDPDAILDRFMSKVNHNRPPSSYTLQDDTWLRPGSTNH